MIAANTSISTKRFVTNADGHRQFSGGNVLTSVPAYIERMDGGETNVDEDNQLIYYRLEIDEYADITEDDQITDAAGNVYTVLELDIQQDDEIGYRVKGIITRKRS